MKITSNYRVHELKSLSELPESEREFFDYVNDNSERRFFRAYGSWYDASEFTYIAQPNTRTEPFYTGLVAPEGSPLTKWQGVQTQSVWDAIVIRYPDDGYGPDTEYVIVGHATW